MKYIKLEIRAKRSIFEAVQAKLIDEGFVQMQIDDPADALDILEHPDIYKYDYLNDEVAECALHDRGSICITLYFPTGEDGRAEADRAKAAVESLVTDGTDSSFSEEITSDDSEWLYKWQEHFKPAKLSERIVVRPSWEDYEAAEGELVIEMDPGMAFGSGLHETTSMCVKALEKYMPADAGVLDVGTGTGILAMTAVLLGAESALGIDIDDEAVRVATENIRKNGLEENIEVMKGDLMNGVAYSPDVIVANLMADLVIMLSPAAAAQLRPGGIYITSGILDIKQEVVSEAVKAAGFEIIEIMEDGEWRAIAAVRGR